MSIKELQDRFKLFAITVMKWADGLPNTPGLRTIRNQIVRSASSSAANYRAACRGKSAADFIYKLKIVEEELDETLLWLEMAVGLEEKYRNEVSEMWKEGDELLRIIVSSIKTKKGNK